MLHKIHVVVALALWSLLLVGRLEHKPNRSNTPWAKLFCLLTESPGGEKPILASTYRFGFKQIEKKTNKKNTVGAFRQRHRTKVEKKNKGEKRFAKKSAKRAPIQSFVFPHLGRWVETFSFCFVCFKLSFSLFFFDFFLFLDWLLFFWKMSSVFVFKKPL